MSNATVRDYGDAKTLRERLAYIAGLDLNEFTDVITVEQLEVIVNDEKLALLERIDRPSKKHEYCENDGSCTLLNEIYEVIREERAALSHMTPLGRKDGDAD